MGSVMEIATTLASLNGLYLLLLASETLAVSMHAPVPGNVLGIFVLLLLLTVSELCSVSSELDDNVLYCFLSSGICFLRRWMGLWFVPHLVVLPLSSFAQPAVYAGIIIIGYFITLLGTAMTVLVLEMRWSRRWDGELFEKEPLLLCNENKSAAVLEEDQQHQGIVASSSSSPIGKNSSGFSSDLCCLFFVCATVSGTALVISLLFKTSSIRRSSEVFLENVMLGAMTLSCYTAAMRLSPQIRAIVHPLIITTGLVWGVLGIYSALFRGIGWDCWKNVLRDYFNKKAGKLLFECGPGNYFSFFLGLVVVSFGMAIFEHRALILRSLHKVILGSLYAVFSGLVLTAVLAKYLGLDTSCISNVLLRCATVPIALEMNCKLGGDSGTVASVCLLTAITGAALGKLTLDMLGVHSSAARGISMGCSAHGLGTAAMVDDPVAFALAATAMTTSGVISAILVSIPSVCGGLLNFAAKN